MRQCFLAIFIIMPLLAGCGQTEQPSPSVAPKTQLTLQFWDTYQEDMLKQQIELYQERYPEVVITLQQVDWEEYWIKFEAYAAGGQFPDVFWMHTDEFPKYASNELLMDLTQLYDGDPLEGYDNYPPELVQRYSYDGKIYGVPKDWDTIVLGYNKEIFDKAGLPYPNESWDWNTLSEVAAEIYERTGIYGFAATMEDQLGYLNTVFSAGGYTVENGRCGIDEEAARQGLSYWISLQTEYDFSPALDDFELKSPDIFFQTGNIAMQFIGSWYMTRYLDKLTDRFDVALLPRCPDPASGNGRSTVYNALAYCIPRNSKHTEEAMELVRFLGGEEAMLIQARNGTVIPSHKKAEQAWFDYYSPAYNVEVYRTMREVGKPYPTSKTKSIWKVYEKNYLLQVYAGNLTIDEAAKRIDAEVTKLLTVER